MPMLQNNEGFTALALAAHGGHAAVVEVLLAGGADADLSNSSGCEAGRLLLGLRDRSSAAVPHL